jgi:hypothetical protein
MADPGVATKSGGGLWKNLALLFVPLLVCFSAIEADGRYALYTEEFSGWVTMRESLLAIGAIARQRGVPGAVIFFPDLRHLERYRSYSHPHIEPMIRAATSQAGLQLIDLVDDFTPYIGREVEISGMVGGTHPNARGYDLIARAVARELEAGGLLGGGSQPKEPR